jgi:hypothetical protein
MCVLLAVTVGVLTTSPSQTAKQSRSELSWTRGPLTGDLPPFAGSEGRFFGVDLPTGFYEPASIDQVERLLGGPIDVVQAFVSWGYEGGEDWNLFPSGRVRDILDRGITPEITWVPTVTGAGDDQPEMRLRAIADGRHDDYIRKFAGAAQAAGGPLLIRFGHEMNDPGSAFSETQNGNSEGSYRAAFRHVHDIFADLDVKNVSWVWAPNIRFEGEPSLARFYPGDEYVDWVGVDGYAYPTAGCRSAADVFNETLADIQTFSSKPMMLSEVAVAEECPNKEAWIQDLFTWLNSVPAIRGLIWWNRPDDRGDYRIDSSPGSLSVFSAVL